MDFSEEKLKESVKYVCSLIWLITTVCPFFLWRTSTDCVRLQRQVIVSTSCWEVTRRVSPLLWDAMCSSLRAAREHCLINSDGISCWHFLYNCLGCSPVALSTCHCKWSQVLMMYCLIQSKASRWTICWLFSFPWCTVTDEAAGCYWCFQYGHVKVDLCLNLPICFLLS